MQLNKQEQLGQMIPTFANSAFAPRSHCSPFEFPLEVTRILCLISERPAPPQALEVPQSEVTSRSLRLHWVPGSDGSSPIRYFTVQTKELPEDAWQTRSSSISHEATSYVIDRYHLELTAGNGSKHRLISKL